MGRAGRIEIAVGDVEHGTVEILLLEQGMQFLGLARRQQLGFQPQIARAAMGHLEPFHPLRRIGEHQPTRPVQAAGLAGQLLQLVIEPDGIALQLGDIGIAVQRMEAAGSMPGRAGGQLIAFQQHDIAPAGLGQMIEHAAPDHAAPDDDDLCLSLHETRPFLILPCPSSPSPAWREREGPA
jgi:hypothetical protein